MAHAPQPLALAPSGQRACYSEWLKVEVAFRYALSYPWAPDAWQEVRQHIPWLLAERRRLRRAGWLNLAWPRPQAQAGAAGGAASSDTTPR